MGGKNEMYGKKLASRIKKQGQYTKIHPMFN